MSDTFCDDAWLANEIFDIHDLLAEPFQLSTLVVVERPGPSGPRQWADAIDLLTTEAIMFVTSARPMTVISSQPTEFGAVSVVHQPPDRLPRVALLDGLPLANHAALQGRLVNDDPDGRAAAYGNGQSPLRRVRWRSRFGRRQPRTVPLGASPSRSAARVPGAGGPRWQSESAKR